MDVKPSGIFGPARPLPGWSLTKIWRFDFLAVDGEGLSFEHALVWDYEMATCPSPMCGLD